MTRQYYRKALGVVAVYDVTSLSSWDRAMTFFSPNARWGNSLFRFPGGVSLSTRKTVRKPTSASDRWS